MDLSHLIYSIPTDELHTLEHLGQNMFWQENNPDVMGISSVALIMMIYLCRVGGGGVHQIAASLHPLQTLSFSIQAS